VCYSAITITQQVDNIQHNEFPGFRLFLINGQEVVCPQGLEIKLTMHSTMTTSMQGSDSDLNNQSNCCEVRASRVYGQIGASIWSRA